MSDPRLDIAIGQIRFAREYMLGMLEGLSDEQWFDVPPGGVTHVGWQVGHLAMAQYGLCLFRQRGRQSGDSQLMSSAFRKRFSKGSTPQPGTDENPSPAEIRAVLDRVHARALVELPVYDAAHLDEPVDAPYAAFATRLGAILFCSHHEMLHAGQIGLLRRALGEPPLR